MKKIILLSNDIDFKTSLTPFLRGKYEHLATIGLEKGIQIIRSSNYEYQEDSNSFCHGEFFNGIGWEDTEEILADLVWYKSNKINYITTLIQKGNIFINRTDYIDFANDKYISSLFFNEESPKSFLFNKKILEDISILPDKLILKPNGGSAGEGILQVNKKDLLKYSPEKYKNYLVQEALDLSTGINGIVEGIHDIRFMIFGNKFMEYILIRTPPKGDFRCNISAGGLGEYVHISKLPQGMLDFINPVLESTTKRFGNLFGSIDIAKSNGRYYIIEFNSSPGIQIYQYDNELEKKYFTQTIDMFLEILGC